jgi:uncharacterized protein YyaL (SSP411 family)
MPANRLARESSPYLLQHAENPVDWHPWGREALDLARSLDRPLFVSIGYSTCHWCHVMERECFMDPATAAAMNEAFVNVKVDREERPDLDAVFMTAAQTQGGATGWPLNLLLTPGGLPFFSASTLPRESGFGRLGLKDLCARVVQAWRDNRAEIEATAARLAAHLRSLHRRPPGAPNDAPPGPMDGSVDGPALARAAFDELSDRYDAQFAGFGTAPKFPSPHLLLFLTDYARRFGQPQALDMAVATLKAMRRGGVYDQVGLGLHRYSTDRQWLTPHFEKMLYDQALFTLAAVTAHEATGDPELAAMARDTLTYVLRDLSTPEGAFATAEDADSLGENADSPGHSPARHAEEGLFYLFTRAEFDAALDPGQPGQADLLARVLGVTAPGNYHDEATGRPTGRNILHLPQPLSQAARAEGLDPAGLAALLETARQALFAARAPRPRPLRDDKVLTDVNGLMIAALARCGRILNDETYIRAAEHAAHFFTTVMRSPAGALLHRYRAGQAGLDGLLEDHAYLAWGFLELAQARPHQGWNRRALALVEELRARFRSPGGGFHQAPEHPSDAVPLLFRPLDLLDGAIPSGNSVALHALIHLSRALDRPDLADEARALAAAFAPQLAAYPSAHAHALAGLVTLDEST